MSTKRATPSSHSGIGEYGRRLGGSSNLLRIIFFIEINSDISLGMDSNCILVALFELVFFFCVICTHYHYVHGEFRSLQLVAEQGCDTAYGLTLF